MISSCSSPVVVGGRDRDAFGRRLRRAIGLLGAMGLVLAGQLTATKAAAPGDRPEAAEKEPQPPETAVLAANTVVRADVPYGKDEKQRLDVYRPRGVRTRPW